MLPRQHLWKIKNPNSQDIKEIINETGYNEAFATVLTNRGITGKDTIRKFLNPQKEDFHNPFLMKDMELACDRIIRAIDNNEKICIYGDYDVDGITSTSILYLYLQENQADIDYYIPDRLNEGYGINKEALQQIKNNNVDLVITVDTGITAVKECSYAREIGLDVIITDHHECQEVIPEALAVVNPKREDCTYPFKMLAGVGVAFKLIHALAIKLNNEDAIWKYLELTSIGTIADIVPLNDENRIIAYLGFKYMKNTSNIGLRKLLESADYDFKRDITSRFIGFVIGPRLNAGGRMGDAKRGVQLFTTIDEKKAHLIAEELNKENQLRQETETKILEEVIYTIENDLTIKNSKIMVVASENWHHGVIGIVSSRIKDRYYRPNIILSIEDGIASGSARSVDDFNLFKALESCKDLLIKFGGHEAAAGLSLRVENIPEFQKRLNEYAEANMSYDTLIPKYVSDMEIDIEDITVDFIKQLELLEPYGTNMPEATFVVKGRLIESRLVGKELNTFRLTIRDSIDKITGVGFRMDHVAPYYEVDDNVKVLCTLNINEYMGNTMPQVLIKDIKNQDETILDQGLILNLISTEASDEFNQVFTKHSSGITKEDCIYIYKVLSAYEKSNKNSFLLNKIIQSDNNVNEEIAKIIAVLNIFKELEIATYEISSPYVSFNLLKNKKVELLSSNLYKKLVINN